MADFNGTILTDKGRNLLAKALTGTELKFTKVSLGDGVWDDSVSPESLTDLVSKKMDLAINALDVTGDGTARLRFVLTNTGLEEGFFTREIGIYADDPDDGEILYAVTYSQNPDFIPSDGVVKVENVTDIYTVVSNAQNVEAVISDTVVIATKDDVNSLKTDLESGNITVSTANNANNLGGEAPESYAKADLSNTDDSVILEKLKNVDGVGSGLDADLVQGVTKDLLGIGGDGYTWVDETANREAGTTYTNTYGKPIMLYVGNNNESVLSFYVDDVEFRGVADVMGTVGLVQIIVPNGSSYKLHEDGLVYCWLELK